LVHVIIERWACKSGKTLKESIRDEHLYKVLRKLIGRLVENKEGWDSFEIFRACINVTGPNERGKIWPPHIDHYHEHSFAILYLNTPIGGDTLLFDSGKIPTSSKECLDIADKVKPYRVPATKGKILIVPKGRTVHTAESPTEGTRAICVVTFGGYKKL
jgi:hypothetical protein